MNKLLSFIPHAEYVTFSKGTQITDISQEQKYVYYLEEGFNRSYTITSSGNEFSLVLLTPGCFFPIGSLFLPPNKRLIYVGMSNGSVLKCLKEEFLKEYFDNKALNDEIGKQLNNLANELIDHSENVLFHDNMHKLLWFICYILFKLDKQDHDKPFKIPFPLTRYDLASWIGCSRESVSRQMSKLAESGYIKVEGNHQFIINNPDQLCKEFSQIKDASAFKAQLSASFE